MRKEKEEVYGNEKEVGIKEIGKVGRRGEKRRKMEREERRERDGER